MLKFYLIRVPTHNIPQQLAVRSDLVRSLLALDKEQLFEFTVVLLQSFFAEFGGLQCCDLLQHYEDSSEMVNFVEAFDCLRTQLKAGFYAGLEAVSEAESPD